MQKINLCSNRFFSDLPDFSALPLNCRFVSHPSSLSQWAIPHNCFFLLYLHICIHMYKISTHVMLYYIQIGIYFIIHCTYIYIVYAYTIMYYYVLSSTIAYDIVMYIICTYTHLHTCICNKLSIYSYPHDFISLGNY